MICICKNPMSLGVVHRADAPCYIPESKREWVGLTNGEMIALSEMKLGAWDLILEVEDKLKGRNT